MKNTKITTGIVRFSFTHLTEPYAISDGQEPKYQTMILIPKSDKKTYEKIVNAQKEAFKDEAQGKLKGLTFDKTKTTLKDGDDVAGERPECADHWTMNVSTKNKPEILGTQRDADGKLKAITDDEEIYSGMYGRVSLNFFAYNSNGNKGISCGLNNVQKTKDGDVLGGGRTNAQDDFADWEDDDEGIDDLL